MASWTRFVLRHRRSVLGFWVAVFVLGGFASSKLGPLLSNTFIVPGTDSDRVRQVIEDRFGDRSDGAFTVVFQGVDARDPRLVASLQRVVDRAAHAVRTGKPTALRVAGKDVVYGDVVSTLDLAHAKGYTDHLLRALGSPPGVRHAYVTGAGPIQHDLDPVFSQDLRKGEGIAIPIAFLV